jgi:hypothetical protein
MSRPQRFKHFRAVTVAGEALSALRDFDRKSKGIHPHYALLMPERDFVLRY